jgi:hypothetical protein
VRVVERRVEVPTAIAPKRQDWPRLLGDLVRQLEDGRIYDRDLLTLSAGLEAVYEAFGRRIGAGRGRFAPTQPPDRQG